MEEEEKQNAQNIKNYYELIHKVSLINLKAAQYLRYEAMNLDIFAYAPSLIGCFLWEDTPQGFVFWKNIDKQLEIQNARK